VHRHPDDLLLIGVVCEAGAMTVHLPERDPEGDEPIVLVALDIT